MKPPLHLSLMMFLCTVMLTTNASTQESEPYSLGLSFGGSDYHIKDEHASPLIYRSIGITPTLQYFYRGGEIRQYGEASYFQNTLESASDNFHTRSWRGRFRFGYLGSVLKFHLLDQPLELFVGGAANSFFTKAEYFITVLPPVNENRAIVSWYWSHSLDLAAFLEYKPNIEEFLTLQIWFPLVSNVSRPHYSPSGDYNYNENDWKIKVLGETEFFPRNLSLDVLIAYQRPLLADFDLQVSYEFFTSAYDIPQTVSMYMNNFRAGVFFRF